jgi:hypothetical protein
VSVGVKWVDQARDGVCCSLAQYTNWLLTLIVLKFVSSDVSTIELLNGCQGCHNLNRTTKQPPVISPGGQFRPMCDEKDGGDSGAGEQIQQPVTLQWTCHSWPQSSPALTYTAGTKEKDGGESHVNDWGWNVCFWHWQHKLDKLRDCWGTVYQLSSLSTALWWNWTDTLTSWITYILLTTAMNLIRTG